MSSQLLDPAKESLLNVEESLPELESYNKVFDSNNLWLWCCYLLLEYDRHPSDMESHFELALRAVR